MSKVQMLRSLVNQRLTAAAEEIFGLFERTIAEHEEELSRSKEENERQRRLLDAVFNPEVRIPRDVQQLLVVQEEVHPELQVWWSSSLDQDNPEPPHIKEDQENPEPPHIKEEEEDPEPSHIKEEEEELWISQEGEQLQWLEEAGQMETEADGADCGGPESDRKSDPERHPGPDTEDSRDWEETQEPQSDLNPLQNNEVPVSDVNCSTGNTSISSPECAGSSDHKGHLEKHSESKTRWEPFKCSFCDKRFRFHSILKSHMIVHTGGAPFSCSICGKTFAQKGSLNYHMTVHTGEKPFSCSVCSKKFLQKGSLNYHMTVHTGVKPFSCSLCHKTFLHKGHLNTHMTVHTGEKPFSCSVCGKTFTHKQSMKRHLNLHTRETN